jgi:hypothetical protein
VNGSLQNHIAAHSLQAHSDAPAVGDGATVVLWTDRNPATVVEVLSPTRVRIQHDRVLQYVNGYARGDQIARDRDGRTEIVTRGKDGRWAISGQRSVTVMLGVRDAYRDPSF